MKTTLINKKIWFFDIYENLCEGTVQKTYTDKNNQELSEVQLEYGGTITVKTKDCFLSKEQCLENDRKKHQIIKAGYMNRIRNVDDLICFCLDHCIGPAEEYTDYDARSAVIKKAKELGIQIPEKYI